MIKVNAPVFIVSSCDDELKSLQLNVRLRLMTFFRSALVRIKDRTSVVLPGWQWDRSSNATVTEQSVDMEFSQVCHS